MMLKNITTKRPAKTDTRTDRPNIGFGFGGLGRGGTRHETELKHIRLKTSCGAQLDILSPLLPAVLRETTATTATTTYSSLTSSDNNDDKRIFRGNNGAGHDSYMHERLCTCSI
jgi:hypothetical protein